MSDITSLNQVTHNCPICAMTMESNGQSWYRCSSCNKTQRIRSHRESRINSQGRTSYILNRDERRDANYRQNYQDFSLEKYNQLFREQEGKCAACRLPETEIDSRTKLLKNLSVDHDHKTGRVRALLCNRCNSSLGMLKENANRAKALARYINIFVRPKPSIPSYPSLWDAISESSPLASEQGRLSDNLEDLALLYTDEANMHRKPFYTCITVAQRSFVFGYTPGNYYVDRWLVASFEDDLPLAMAVRDHLKALSAEQPDVKRPKVKRTRIPK